MTVVLVGRSGVGKSTTANVLAELTGRALVEVGDVVRSGAVQAGRSPLDHARQVIGSGDETHFVRRAIDEVRRRGPSVIVGPRLPAELAYLRRELPPVLAIGLLLPTAQRWARIARRSSAFDPAAQAVRDEIEENWGLARTLADCDWRISTVGSPRAVVVECLRHWSRFGASAAI
ncbi:hypothetical protein CcI49_00595 [Frankia sp. CcI49]|nr:hypothetical protein ACG83_01305 [Frankia sp. R43]ONH62591.1 hypothetical protein CcI49_00595 [Frankia sp. CcI49]